MKSFRHPIFFLCLSPGLVFADCEIEDIDRRVSTSGHYFEFQQTKTVASLSRPLTSAGIIWVSPDQELVWQVLSPIKSTTVLSVGEVREYNRRDELQPAINDPVSADLSDVFLNVLSGQFGALDSSFSNSLLCDEESWEITLTPVNARFARLITTVVVSGNETIEQIYYQESRGDETNITLLPSTESSSRLEIYLEN